jgi:hypothetical protein
MKVRKNLLLTIGLLLFVAAGNLSAAGSDEKTVVDTGTISQQFKYIVNKSTRYNDYRAIRVVWFKKLQSHVLDTLTLLKTDLKSSQAQILSQSNEIDSLNAQLLETKEKLDKSTLEKDSISIFGMLMPKNAYNSIVWLLIVGLIVLISMLFIAYKRSHIVTIRTKHELQETKEEFESHRKRAREREEKMARKHLDELLKYKYKSNQVGTTNKNHP